ncbi:MAG: M48 family metalloprotease [Pseudomonadales bacterium]|nr:M48 family metalloprotease [Pseudomonadales bacterium]MCB1669376.1 M48 family metalloprotease [Pseudomonadales bacterium]MCP5172553.1 M48 family metalloprotease [Pseudomonadales bacterium]MCP5303282.1 M48 family metalloprotease [Pseudomonadales bacterium]
MKKITLHGFALLLTASLCTTTFAAKYKPINEIPHSVPETEEEQQIWDIGRAHQKEVRETGEVVNDPDMEQHLEALASQLMGEMVSTIGLEVNVLVFKDPTVNAWVYPDGTIAVQTGLLAELKNEAQLAAILGHEISHFLNRHAYIQIKSKQKQSAIGKGLGLLATAAVAAKTGSLNTGLMDTGQIWADLVTSGYSRKLETKADEQGLQLMITAGFDPNQALPAFEALRIKDDNETNLSQIWSSHPDIDSRLKNIKKQIKKLKSPPLFTPAEHTYIEKYGTALLVDAQLDMQQRRYQQADNSLKRYTSIIKTEPLAFFMLGENIRKQHPEGPDFAARLDAYQQAINADSNYAKAYKELGMAYRQQQLYERASAALEQYLSLAPEAVDAPIIRWYLNNTPQETAL